MLWFYALMAQGSAMEIPHETLQLDNGLHVILIEDHKLPQVVVNTWYGVGSYDDPKGASGFAHLFEHLMFMGTTVIPNSEFDIRMEVAIDDQARRHKLRLRCGEQPPPHVQRPVGPSRGLVGRHQKGRHMREQHHASHAARHCVV